MPTLLDTVPDELRERLSPRPQPEWIEPMLATLMHDAFSDRQWIYERKLDGERCLAFCSGSVVRLLSRNRKDLNVIYPEVAETLVDLRSRLSELERCAPAFVEEDLPGSGVHWVEPRLVGQFGFTEWTGRGRLRHPRYVGLRRGKEARDVVRERAT